MQAYRAQGVSVDTITVQNEPQNRAPSRYPGTDMPSWQEEKVIEALGPMLHAAHLPTKILAYHHNWSEHPNDIASTPLDENADINFYPQQVLSSRAARWISGTAYHCYFGDPSAMSALHAQYPDKDIYFTECSGSQSSDPVNTISDTLKWHSRNLIIGSPRNWAKTVINWNVALDPSGGPHVGGCDNCTPIVTVGPGDAVTRNAEYYTLGHLSRFVKPGAVRIASTSFGTTGWNGQVMDEAFRDPDGTTVLVAHNENDNPQAFAVSEGGLSFTYTLPGGALATFTWRGEPRWPELALRARPVRLARHRRSVGPERPVLSGRRRRQRGRRRRQHPLVDRRRAAAGPVSPGRPRPRPARATGRVRHRREHSETSRAATPSRSAPTDQLADRGGHRRRHRPADHGCARRIARPVRADDAHGGECQLVERRRHPCLRRAPGLTNFVPLGAPESPRGTMFPLSGKNVLFGVGGASRGTNFPLRPRPRGDPSRRPRPRGRGLSSASG